MDENYSNATMTSNETFPINSTGTVNITIEDPYLYNQTKKFVFSKDVDSLPITRTEMSNG